MKHSTNTPTSVPTAESPWRGAGFWSVAETHSRLLGIGDPLPVFLEVTLEPVRTHLAHGRATYQAKEMGGAYRFDAELVVPFKDFLALGVDPENGFDDETVVLTIGNLGIALRMTFSRISPAGAIYAVTDFGTGLWPRHGDLVTVEVNAKKAASGKF